MEGARELLRLRILKNSHAVRRLRRPMNVAVISAPQGGSSFKQSHPIDLEPVGELEWKQPRC